MLSLPTYLSFLSVMLTAVTVVLTALAIGIGVVAAFTFKGIKEEASKIASAQAERTAAQIAEEKATETATQIAQDAATQVAQRVADDALSEEKLYAIVGRFVVAKTADKKAWFEGPEDENDEEDSTRRS